MRPRRLRPRRLREPPDRAAGRGQSPGPEGLTGARARRADQLVGVASEGAGCESGAMSASKDAVVVGAGLAGGAVAWALARRGWRVVLVEREERPGQHASGRNAGLVRRIERDPDVARLARAGAALLAAPPADLSSRPLYRRTGSRLIASGEDVADWEQAADEARADGVEVRAVPAAGASPYLRAAEGLAFATPEDGVADPHEVLSAYLTSARAQGVEVRCGAIASLSVEGERVTGVVLSTGEALAASVVVNAAGPWASALARAAGAQDVELRHFRRHLFYTGPLAGVTPDAPWVWDLSRGFYLRPESSGLLLCACDHEPRPAEDTQPVADAHERLAAKVAALAPELIDHPLARSWAGLRSFAPDGRFVIGPDAQRAGLFWATGLGGYGLTTSGAVGLLVARALCGEASQAELEPFAPARFQGALMSQGDAL